MAIDLSKQLVARWPQPETSHLPLLKRIGIEALVVSGAPGPAFEQAAAAAGVAVAPESSLTGVIARGVWPGIRRPGRRPSWDNDLFASASAEPWIDSNLYLVPLERALSGNPSPVAAYLASPETGLTPDRPVPFQSLELALIEARLLGGNFVLSIDPRYRAALLSSDAKALAAWDSLGRTAAWLRQQTALFGRPAPPMITALVEAGNASAEIANLLYRRNASPRLVSVATPPAPDPKQILVLVAASLNTVPDAVWRHAEAGSTVVVDDAKLIRPAWRRVKEEPDREFYSLGAGRVVAYRKRISDPSEFALDTIDLAGHRHRTARAWNAQSSVVFATAGPSAGEALLHIVNYGSTPLEDVQARLHGHFTQATLLRPEAPPAALKTQTRGLATEVFPPSLDRVAVIRFRA